MTMCKIEVKWSALVLAAVAVGLAHAQQNAGLDYSLGVSLGHSDNINESASAPISQSLLIPRVNFTWNESGTVFRAQAYGQLEYRDYLGGAFNNELRGQLAGVVNWFILPRRLYFDFEDYAAVQPVNVFLNNAPGNQQQTNVFTLGPTLLFRLGDAMRGAADLRLSYVTASVNKQFDSERSFGALHAIRDLNPTDEFSANLDGSHAHFTHSSGDLDYDRYSAYLRYLSKLSEIDLDFALGYSRIQLSGGSANSGVSTSGRIAWRASASSRFEFGVARQYSDAAQQLASSSVTMEATGIGPTTPIMVGSTQITPQVFLERSISAAYIYQIPRLNIRIAPYASSYNYSLLYPSGTPIQNGGANQTTRGLNASIDYLWRPLWNIGANVYDERRSYSGLNRHDESRRYNVYIAEQLSRHWSWRADVSHNQRTSTLAGQAFDENVVMFTLIYKRR